MTVNKFNPGQRVLWHAKDGERGNVPMRVTGVFWQDGISRSTAHTALENCRGWIYELVRLDTNVPWRCHEDYLEHDQAFPNPSFITRLEEFSRRMA